MSNNTTRFSSENSSISCSLNNSKRECDACNHVIFASYIIIIILSPVAVVGNALILAAIWKKTVQRTPFHILLSGLAFTDLCTGSIAQHFVAAGPLLSCVNPRVLVARPVLISTIKMIGTVSSVYFVAVTLLIITLMSIERWLHMSRRSLVTSRRSCFTFAVLLLIPIPLVLFKTLTIKQETSMHEDIAVAVFMLFCYLTTSVAYFKVFRIIRQHQQQVQGNQSSQNFVQPAINLAKYKKSVVSMLYILTVFSFCFLPFIVSTAVYFFNEGGSLEVRVALNVSIAALFLSSSVNPVLYLLRMNDVRNGVKQLLHLNS